MKPDDVFYDQLLDGQHNNHLYFPNICQVPMGVGKTHPKDSEVQNLSRNTPQFGSQAPHHSDPMCNII